MRRSALRRCLAPRHAIVALSMAVVVFASCTGDDAGSGGSGSVGQNASSSIAAATATLDDLLDEMKGLSTTLGETNNLMSGLNHTMGKTNNLMGGLNKSMKETNRLLQQMLGDIANAQANVDQAANSINAQISRLQSVLVDWLDRIQRALERIEGKI